MKLLRKIKKPFMVSITLLIICGIIYPAFMTGVSQILFKDKANGSIIYADGKAVGAEYVGQEFTDARFMHGRPSAYNYNTYTLEQKENGEYSGPSSGSNNYAPSNPKLLERVNDDVDKILSENPTVKKQDIPADLVTESGSGLDPHISEQAAKIQLDRISKETGISAHELENIVKNNTSGKVLGIFGENTVNVLGVNLDIAKKLGIVNNIQK